MRFQLAGRRVVCCDTDNVTIKLRFLKQLSKEVLIHSSDLLGLETEISIVTWFVRTLDMYIETIMRR